MTGKVYRVEKLESIRKEPSKGKYSGLFVFVKWKNYSASENTWEPVENLNKQSAVSMLEELESEI